MSAGSNICPHEELWKFTKALKTKPLRGESRLVVITGEVNKKMGINL